MTKDKFENILIAVSKMHESFELLLEVVKSQTHEIVALQSRLDDLEKRIERKVPVGK